MAETAQRRPTQKHQATHQNSKKGHRNFDRGGLDIASPNDANQQSQKYISNKVSSEKKQVEL
jgi:hypothetical protein